MKLTCAQDEPAVVTLGYAASGDGAAISGVSPRWGQLKDSDPLVGQFAQRAQDNCAVSFEPACPERLGATFGTGSAGESAERSTEC